MGRVSGTMRLRAALTGLALAIATIAPASAQHAGGHFYRPPAGRSHGHFAGHPEHWRGRRYGYRGHGYHGPGGYPPVCYYPYDCYAPAYPPIFGAPGAFLSFRIR